MRLQEDVEREESDVKRRSTENEERAARRVEAERNDNWQKVAVMDRRKSEMCAQKRCERQDFLARKRRAVEERKCSNRDPSSDTEL